VVPLVHRIPFQQVLLEYLGEVRLFYALHDDPGPVFRLLDLLDQQLREILDGLAAMPATCVEFPDNLHGGMTNPRLFARYCLEDLQHYTEILHGQGKRAGSHTDGDVGPLLALLRESGLDFCESISPFPLTQCPFDEVWDAWRGGPIIWGGIPSPILEPVRTHDDAFRPSWRTSSQRWGQTDHSGCGRLAWHNSIERGSTSLNRLKHMKSEGTPPTTARNRRKSQWLRVLSDDQIHAIHAASLDVLAHTGCLVPVVEARDLLAGAGAAVEGDRVYIKDETVEWALGNLQPVTLYNRLGESALPAEGRPFGALVDNLYVQDAYLPACAVSPLRSCLVSAAFDALRASIGWRVPQMHDVAPGPDATCSWSVALHCQADLGVSV
jgi:hypothetical protein